MATALKQLPSAVDQILMPDVWELFEHWTQWPPEFVLLRGFVGYEAPAVVKQGIDSKSAAGLAQVFGGAQKAPDHVKQLMDWAEQMKQQLGVKVGES
jgi:hypothetical protein